MHEQQVEDLTTEGAQAPEGSLRLIEPVVRLVVAEDEEQADGRRLQRERLGLGLGSRLGLGAGLGLGLGLGLGVPAARAAREAA